MREKKKREKSLSLEARPRRNSSDEPMHKTSPRHYASRSSTLPRKPYFTNGYETTTAPDGDSPNCSPSIKSHSLPSSNVNSPKITPHVERNRDNSSRTTKKTLRLNNAVASPINNIIRGYRPTAFSSVRPEEKRPVAEPIRMDRKSNLDQSVASDLMSNNLKDQTPTDNNKDDDELDFDVVQFKSRTAQRILQGISDSVDTLADLNNCDELDGKNYATKWNETLYLNCKNSKNQRNNSGSECILKNGYERKLSSSKSAYCMSRGNYTGVVPAAKMTSVSAGNTPLFETAA